jgi:hypothetical protein
MASLDGFNANEVQPNEGFDVIPEGWYPAVITESEKKATKNGNGHLLALTLVLLEEAGKYKNRKAWDRLNLWNPSAKAVDIARGTMSAICRAVGRLTPNDSSELHDLPLLIHLKVERNSETGNMQNVIKGYKAINPPTNSSATGKPSPSPSPAPANGNAAPWGAKR